MKKMTQLLTLALLFAIGTSFTFAAAPLDFDGDGKTDIGIIRSYPPSNGITQMEWWIQSSANPNNSTATQFGIACQIIENNCYEDEVVPRDYDGDNKTDIAIWRAVTSGFFYILRSSDNTVLVEQYGTYLDNPHATADYDGDGRIDLAVYRTPDVPNPNNEFIYRGTSNNPAGNLTYIPVGGGTNARLIPGDFNGDGRADYGVHPNNSSQYILRFSNTLATETVIFGSFNDYVTTGDFDGDGKTDFAFTRGGSRVGLAWYILERDGGGTGLLNPIYFGSAFTASHVAEKTYFGYDFDGDGRTDITVVERSPTTGLQFQYRRSSDLVVRTVNFGTFSDSPIRLYR